MTLPRNWPSAAGLAFGYLADRVFGDPRRGHPVALFGAAAGWLERRCYADRHGAGLMHTAALVGTAAAVGAALERLTASHSAAKILTTAKEAIRLARTQVEGRVQALEAEAGAGTASDAVLHALRPFFDHHQLPNAKWTRYSVFRCASERAGAGAVARCSAAI